MTSWAGGISADYANVVLVSIDTGDSKVLVRGGYDGRYWPDGYLTFGRAGGVFAVSFDAATGITRGEPVQVATGVSMESFFGQVHASAAAEMLAYVPGGDRAIGRLAWIDRSGTVEMLPPPPALYGVVDLAPAAERLAVHVGDVTDYLWVYDFARREGRKLSSGESAGWPVWSPDGRQLAFTAWASGERWRLKLRSTDGQEPPRDMAQVAVWDVAPSSWSPDGRVVSFDSFASQKISMLSVEGNSTELQGAAGWGSYFSPDGKWIAFTRTNGRSEVFVRSYPEGRVTRQISVDGGLEPLWCRCGELFYRVGNRWMSAQIRTEPELQWEPPIVAFETDFIDTPGRSYAVSPDGRRLLVVKRAEPDVRNRIDLVTNWTAALHR